jgi:2-dehydropantoate 2-reductase
MQGQSQSSPAAAPSVLVVGAGSVGQVFGYHLARGGARVTFFVRPQYRQAAARGFPLQPLNRWRRAKTPVLFTQFNVVSSTQELAVRRFDQVYLALPSTAVRGSWLGELIASVADASLVSLQPDAQDHALIRAAGARPEALIYGAIALVSYAAPLPGETRFASPTTAYWLPPFARSPFSGPAERTAQVVAALERGGLPARHHPDVESVLELPNAIGMTYLIALEAAGWSVRALAKSALLPLCMQAVREAIAIVGASKRPLPLGSRAAAWPRLLRLALWIAARVVPFPLEPYLKQHFTKVGEQTRLIVGALIARGAAYDVRAPALSQLVAALPQRSSAR